MKISKKGNFQRDYAKIYSLGFEDREGAPFFSRPLACFLCPPLVGHLFLLPQSSKESCHLGILRKKISCFVKMLATIFVVFVAQDCEARLGRNIQSTI
jgi:hypothetical protein